MTGPGLSLEKAIEKLYIGEESENMNNHMEYNGQFGNVCFFLSVVSIVILKRTFEYCILCDVCKSE